MAVGTITFEPNGPLSQSQQHEVAAAHDRARKIRKTAAIAGFNGWATGVLAACSAPFDFANEECLAEIPMELREELRDARDGYWHDLSGGCHCPQADAIAILVENERPIIRTFFRDIVKEQAGRQMWR